MPSRNGGRSRPARAGATNAAPAPPRTNQPTNHAAPSAEVEIDPRCVRAFSCGPLRSDRLPRPM
eukprot:1901203-Prymnesium_polylepis.1